MNDDLAREARAAMTIWEANPQRQALARILGLHPGQITDDMLRRVNYGARTYHNPPLQQIPRRRK